jgi:branched-chain amino acid aminotransferase
MMETSFTQDESAQTIIQLIKKNQIKSKCYVRPIIFRGVGEFGLNPFGSPVQYAIIAFPLGAYLEEKGVRVCTSSWRRTPDDSIPSFAKTSGAYVNSVLAKLEAIKNGYDEAILLDSKGYLSEGSGENIFLLRDGRIYTPSLSSSILEGITRRSVLDIASNEGISITETKMLKSELYVCDEAFFTGTAAEVTPIIEIDNRPIADGKPGPYTKLFKEKFTKIIQGKDEKYKNWLTLVY